MNSLFLNEGRSCPYKTFSLFMILVSFVEFIKAFLFFSWLGFFFVCFVFCFVRTDYLIRWIIIPCLRVYDSFVAHKKKQCYEYLCAVSFFKMMLLSMQRLQFWDERKDTFVNGSTVLKFILWISAFQFS